MNISHIATRICIDNTQACINASHRDYDKIGSRMQLREECELGIVGHIVSAVLAVACTLALVGIVIYMIV